MDQRWIVGIVSLAATMVLVARTSEAPLPAAHDRSSLPRVQIEQELVTIPVTPPKPVGVPPAPAVQHVRGTVPVARPEARPRLLTRTARAVLGDGRYRPEPFPRPGSRR